MKAVLTIRKGDTLTAIHDGQLAQQWIKHLSMAICGGYSSTTECLMKCDERVPTVERPHRRQRTPLDPGKSLNCPPGHVAHGRGPARPPFLMPTA